MLTEHRPLAHQQAERRPKQLSSRLCGAAGRGDWRPERITPASRGHQQGGKAVVGPGGGVVMHSESLRSVRLVGAAQAAALPGLAAIKGSPRRRGAAHRAPPPAELALRRGCPPVSDTRAVGVVGDQALLGNGNTSSKMARQRSPAPRNRVMGFEKKHSRALATTLPNGEAEHGPIQPRARIQPGNTWLGVGPANCCRLGRSEESSARGKTWRCWCPRQARSRQPP